MPNLKEPIQEDVLLLGIDQGSSKTMAVISDLRGNLLGLGRAGGGYHAITGMGQAMGVVADAVECAADHAGLSRPLRFQVVGAGLTGADFDYEYDLLKTALARTLEAETILVRNDCMIARRAGAQLPHGAVLCAGTGMNCGIHSADGQEFIFGYYVHDADQGGSSLGMQALLAVFDANVGLGPDTLLTNRILSHYQERTVDDLLQSWITKRIPHGGVKNLAQLPDQCALEGDEVSISLLQKFGTALARYASVGLQRAGLQNAETEVVLSGSLFKNRTPFLRDAVETAIRAHIPMVRIVEARYEPVVGGVLTALDHMYGGFANDTALLRNIEVSAKRLNLIRMESDGNEIGPSAGNP